jgi:hypothetical protein
MVRVIERRTSLAAMNETQESGQALACPDFFTDARRKAAPPTLA